MRFNGKERRVIGERYWCWLGKIVSCLKSKGTGGNNGSSGNTVLEEVVGDVAASGGKVGLLELAVSDGVDGGRDGRGEFAGKNRLRDGEGRVVLDDGAGHLAGNLIGRLGLGATSVTADEVRDQRADCVPTICMACQREIKLSGLLQVARTWHSEDRGCCR